MVITVYSAECMFCKWPLGQPMAWQALTVRQTAIQKLLHLIIIIFIIINIIIFLTINNIIIIIIIINIIIIIIIIISIINIVMWITNSATIKATLFSGVPGD